MVSAEQLFVLSIVAFSVYAILVSIEKRKGRRILFISLRNFFDVILVRLYNFIKFWLNYIGRHIIKLSWYYSIHRFLQLIMTILVRVYDHLEVVFMRNRDRARVIKIERKKLRKDSHLQQVADHKEATSLTKSEKHELLAKKLEGE